MTQNSENRALTDKFMLRLPDGMRDRIKAAAESNNRSMNAEIVATLEEKYPRPVPFEWNSHFTEYAREADRLIHAMDDLLDRLIEAGDVDERKEIEREMRDLRVQHQDLTSKFPNDDFFRRYPRPTVG